MSFTCEFNGRGPGPLVPDPRRPPPSGGNLISRLLHDDTLTLAGLPGSIGSIGTAGDAYDNAQAETTVGLYKSGRPRDGSS